MKLTTLPRGVAKLEYTVVRAPLSLLERQVFARYLADDAALRLGFERLLGSLDSFAGRILADEQVARRGQALSHRSAMLDKAAMLEAKAEQRKSQADQQLEASAEQARQDRLDADRKRQANITAARRKEQAEKRQARQQAEAQAAAEKQRSTQQAQAKINAAERAKAAERNRIANRQEQAAAAPKRQLADANSTKQAADAKRGEAGRLSALATAEREQRQAGTA